jgi:acetylornithine/succinyldiaminopimelate/putrescine aminotransferase
MLCTEKLADGLPVGSHGSTFGGNSLACAAGLSILSIFDEEHLVQNAHAVGSYLGEKLEAMAADAALPNAIEARGKGLLRGLKVAPTHDALAVLGKMRELGVLASTAGGDVIRLAPPLNVTRGECDRALEALRTALATTPAKA